MRNGLTLAFLLWCGSGCAYKMKLASSPAGAEVTLPSGETVVTPTVVKLRWAPFGKQMVIARAAGFRPLEVDLRREEIRASHYFRDALFRPKTWLGAPRGEVSLILVPEHGPVGTWTPEDVP